MHCERISLIIYMGDDMEHLKQLRKSKNLLQKDMAQILGVERTTYVKYENGTSEPSNEILKKLADYFEVSTDYLLDYTEIPNGKAAPKVSDDDIKVALFGGDGEVTDEMWDEVRNFVDYVKSKHSKGGK